jgi:dihydropteroate synthase
MKQKYKKTFFSSHKTINCGGKLLSLSKPVVMGVLNITPDSFYDGGKHKDTSTAIKHVAAMLEEGAAIIDIGAVSTKPGAEEVTQKEEKARLVPVLKEVLYNFPKAIISVDTYRSEIARIAVDCGAQMINDISAGSFDSKMFQTITRLQVPYIIMHIQGTPANMQTKPVYKNVVKDVIKYLSEKVAVLKKLGVNDIIIDPGFGFGKTLEHNYELLNSLEYFTIFELPLMVGFSRKSMINKLLGTKPDDALNGTTALNTIALIKGANILRVHDVKEAMQAIRIVEKLKSVE